MENLPSVHELIYIAAHGGFDARCVPLGGGLAVAGALLRSWVETGRFRVTLVAPGDFPHPGVECVRLPGALPDGRPPSDLVHLSEREYAGFCQRFESGSTAYLEQRAAVSDARATCVLCNDIAEGPDFEAAAALGYPVVTLLHVDVLHYFTRFYLRGHCRPERLARLYERAWRGGIAPLLPGVLRLVLDKQRAAVACSRRLVVPSRAMGGVLLRCYPRLSPERIAVLPWGLWPEEVPEAEVAAEVDALPRELGVAPEDTLLLTLSRISPEKGIHRALEALLRWEADGGEDLERIVLCICGAAAFMRGEAYLRHLRDLASRLRRVRVLFPGHVAGAPKQAWLRRADLFLFLSEHESYGLTLAEAMRAGLPVLSSDHGSARDLVPLDGGVIVSCGTRRQAPERILAALRDLLADRPRLRAMGQAAAHAAAHLDFGRTAADLADILDAERENALSGME